MRQLSCLVLLVAVVAGGCTQKKTPTPRPVAERYVALIDSLADTPPAAAADRLVDFLQVNGNYTIADTVQWEINLLQATAAEGYHQARELARQGEFEQAEILLQDLANHLPATPAGTSAREYLAFDFGYGRAQWLMIRQRFAECEVVARELLTHDLTPAQTNQVEKILDNLGYVDAATSQAEKAEAHNACRHLSVMLMQQFVMEGRYPYRFSIEDVKGWDAHDSEFILRALSAVEEYRATDEGYSFVGVSVNGHHRFQVTDGRIQTASN